jgi:hypothetical protein
LVAEASRIFQRLDAQAWLERVGRMSPTPATEAAPTV